ncbi:MAG: ATP-dependent DNA helicase RecG [Clostridia bacterium]
MTDGLKTDIQYLKGVGPKRAESFRKLGIGTVEELLGYFPRTYEDRSIVKTIGELEDGDNVSIRAVVQTFEYRKIRKNLSIAKALVSDGVSHALVTWFNQDYLKNSIIVNGEYWFFGRFHKKGFLFECTNPVLSQDFKTFTVIVPVYQKTAALTQYAIRKCVRNALDFHVEDFPDPFPGAFRSRHSLVDAAYAIRNIHYPADNDHFFHARRRLVFEELFILQLGLFLIKKNNTIHKSGYPMHAFDRKAEYLEKLGFCLTGAQERVIHEIQQDLMNDSPMNRLLQGDVGSGKTVVAACAIIDAAENGFQSAFMAPTEILAMQHYENLRGAMEGLGVKTAYLGGKMKGQEKRIILDEIERGVIHLVIGTHALIQESVSFSKLGLVITDEQHRFGVNQRSTLVKKGNNPHVLVMTATPIPRTLALILYGDLDISVIDEMPPGRKPVETHSVTEEKRSRILSFMEKRIENGNQAYVVCPLINENEENDLQSVEKTHETLRLRYPQYQVGLIHGNMKSDDKDRVMTDFYAGKIHILVSTTVIEVGVNVPNATLMIIENAERFGLAQLHQLRGRVGRGAEKSYCIMFNQSSARVAMTRMRTMEKSNDGFFISEEDLKLRGPGDFFGTKQHGLPDMKIANLYKDMLILKEAQEAAAEMAKDLDSLLSGENRPIYDRIINTFEDNRFI